LRRPHRLGIEAFQGQDHMRQGRDVFHRQELVQVWIIHYMEIIGEAVRYLSDALRSKHTGIPWSRIIGMRNILVHNYFGIDLEEIWSTVETLVHVSYDLHHCHQGSLRPAEAGCGCITPAVQTVMQVLT
jgi:uncharacterized protein with HEPN domain